MGVQSESKFDLFWTKVYREPQTHSLSEPRLPRNGASASVDHRDALKAHYRRIYSEALDLITNCISQRFDQPGYQNYKFLQELLVKASKGEEYLSELKFLCDFYSKDIIMWILSKCSAGNPCIYIQRSRRNIPLRYHCILLEQFLCSEGFSFWGWQYL